jgi:hypothetical protein
MLPSHTDLQSRFVRKCELDTWHWHIPSKSYIASCSRVETARRTTLSTDQNLLEEKWCSVDLDGLLYNLTSGESKRSEILRLELDFPQTLTYSGEGVFHAVFLLVLLSPSAIELFRWSLVNTTLDRPMHWNRFNLVRLKLTKLKPAPSLIQNCSRDFVSHPRPRSCLSVISRAFALSFEALLTMPTGESESFLLFQWLQSECCTIPFCLSTYILTLPACDEGSGHGVKWFERIPIRIHSKLNRNQFKKYVGELIRVAEKIRQL